MSPLNRNVAAAAIAGLSLSAGIGACSSTDNDDAASRSGATTTAAVTTTSPSGDRATYEDGDYTATGRYGSLPSSIDVSVTLDDAMITAVEVTPHATDPTSRDYQERFADAVPRLVVGRNIDDVELSRVAGSSGTPDGFNAALERIKAEAASS